MAASPKKKFQKNLNNNLNILRLIYVVSYTLGYFRIGQSFPYDFFNWTSQDAIIAFAAAVLFSLSLRFFWAVGNIRRYMMSKIRPLHNCIGEYELRNKLTWPIRRMMIIHVPILMAHSFLFYVLAAHFDKIDKLLSAPASAKPYIIEFLAIYCALLVLNSAWLWTLKPEDKPERFWMYNNLTGAFAGALWTFVGYVLISDPVLFVVGLSGSEFILVVGLIIFSINSLVDLWHCYEAYTVEDPG